MSRKLIKVLSLLLCCLLIFQQAGFSQVLGQPILLAPSAMPVNPLIPEIFRPIHLRYLSFDNLNNNFKVLLDKGSSDSEPKKTESIAKELFKYFLIGLALPNQSFWVNLRPDTENRIIDEQLARTDVGKILLEADLQLKKDTAGLTSPLTPTGKEYWKKLYQKAGELFGEQNVEIPTFTRPWIVPGEIILRETPYALNTSNQAVAMPSAYIYKATLKVMLEQDYLFDAAGKHSQVKFEDQRMQELNEYSSQLIRKLVVPRLNEVINSSKRYAALRQVYYSLIMAQWFKSRYSGKTGFYSNIIGSGDLTNLTSKENWSKDFYSKEYRKSFKNGEYNIQEAVTTPYGQTIRSYCSGGMRFSLADIPVGAVSGPITVILADTLPAVDKSVGACFSIRLDGGVEEAELSEIFSNIFSPSSSWMTFVRSTLQWWKDYAVLREKMIRQALDVLDGAYIQLMEVTSAGYRVKTNKGTYFLPIRVFRMDANGWEEEIIDSNGNRWRISNLSQRVVCIPMNDDLLVEPEPFLLDDDTDVFDEWTNLEIPRQAETVVKNLLEKNAYPERIKRKLRDLQDKAKNGDIVDSLPLDSKGGDVDYWETVTGGIIGKRWDSNISQTIGIAYFYRLILEAVEYWDTKEDPYRRDKEEDFNKAAEGLPVFLDQINQEDSKDRLSSLIRNALWANIFDPVNPINANRQILIVDDLTDTAKLLKSGEIWHVDYEPDNAGSEILADLLLIQHLLSKNLIKTVDIHVKNYPFLVSDATEEDVYYTIGRLRAHKRGDIRKIGDDLQELLNSGRLKVTTDRFSTSGLSFKIIPLEKYTELKNNPNHNLIISKGDFNYRRLVDNRYWGIEQLIDYVVPYYLRRVLILRTAKNQVIIGADPSAVAILQSDREWYRKGQGGMIQLVRKDGGGGNISNSAQVVPDTLGGIDFRSLPIVVQATKQLGVNMASAQAKELSSLDRVKEWAEIKSMLTSGSVPSADKIRKYIQASCIQDSIIQDRDKVILCISNILRTEEDNGSFSDPQIKDMLVALESLRNKEELKQVFLGVE